MRTIWQLMMNKVCQTYCVTDYALLYGVFAFLGIAELKTTYQNKGNTWKNKEQRQSNLMGCSFL